MNLGDWGASPAGLWLIGAVLLGIAELVVPGVFLVFLAIAAAVTAALVALLPDVPVGLQLLSFGLWSVIAVLAGRRLYATSPVPSADPLLNDRGARLVGQTVRVTDAIEHGSGRVRIGDGEWPASGPDTVAGAKVRIVAVEGGVVRVAAVD